MYHILETHPELVPFAGDINLRMDNYKNKLYQLLQGRTSLKDFANAHEYYGFHQLPDGWVYREWAPAADQLYLTGEFNGWHWTDTPMNRIDNGNWELLPLYTRRAVQDWQNGSWCCEVWDDLEPYPWTDGDFHCNEKPLIYEAHVGMCTEDSRIATYRDFADQVLPHVKDAGYNTIQLMAIMEHPFYGSFGYQVSNFFAASSRFGYPEDLKYLVNKAHEMGIRVLLDVVHSHAVGNTLEGINLFDGTSYQFFHDGAKGDHPAWGTKCFNYDKPEVIHFDGFRFDGVTSMLYHDHALGTNFSNLGMYFTMNTDIEAVTYLQLANELIRQVNPRALTVAEDMSGMPGMCEPVADGGIGFDYRLGMGLPDMWIKLSKKKDEDWYLEDMWRELTFRNAGTIAYVESHDQALVGDKTMIFRYADAAMYTDMEKTCHTDVIDRAVALHKMTRLLTLAAGGNGYLTFMGNEFGHPEWIDFPRPGNGNSFHYCRRQWSLLNNDALKYQDLYAFDRDMIHAAKEYHILDQDFPYLKWIHNSDHVIAFERGGLLFAFNFSPIQSFVDYPIPVGTDKPYRVLFSSDDECYNGFGRIRHDTHPNEDGHVKLYLPLRTAVVLAPEE